MMPKFDNGNGNAEKTKDQLYIKSYNEVNKLLRNKKYKIPKNESPFSKAKLSFSTLQK